MTRRRKLALGLAAALLAPAATFLLLDRLFPFPFEALGRPASTVVEDRDGRPLRIVLAPDQKWRLPVTLDDVPPESVRAFVLGEDARFGRHPGVDPLAVLRAARDNLRAGRIVSGASTIAMQVARMVEPKPRTLGGKLREAFRALQLTWHLDREARLAAWLNLAPFGGNVEGLGAAAWFWFGKPAASLSTGEVALLVTLPRAPARLDPSRYPAEARRARDAALDRLERLGTLSPERAREARAQPLPGARRPAPFAAPHWTRLVVARYPGERMLRTTLDGSVERAAEEVLRGRIADLRGRGIGNAAVVVLENRTRAVRGYVGSAGFADTAFAGQVDGAAARRSPGSTLKPLLYAAAFDDGRLVPESWVLDLPTDFAGYVAENYDGVYRGRVTAREALAQSLNAPAVRTLAALGLEPFLALLRRGGLSTLDRPAAEYGLPLILGGGEVTLLELTNLYATLAERGRHRPYVLLEREARDARDGDGEAIVSPETAALVTEILTEIERPDLPGSWRLARGAPSVAWKTGTSYGHRDAWAVGYSGRYTIGIWTGNFDGTPAKGISGARDAGPLLFDLFRSIDREDGPRARTYEPRAVPYEIELCELSRERPGPLCPRRVRAESPSRSTRLPRCTWHERAFVDTETGRVLPGQCLAGRPHRSAVLERYPAELVAWWRAQGRPVPAQPVTSERCTGLVAEGAPAIVAPDPATPYVLRRDAPRAYQRVPLVARPGPRTARDAERLFWYQDGRLVASGAADAALFVPLEPGVHRLVVVDGAGRSDAVTYRVD